MPQRRGGGDARSVVVVDQLPRSTPVYKYHCCCFSFRWPLLENRYYVKELPEYYYNLPAGTRLAVMPPTGETREKFTMMEFAINNFRQTDKKSFDSLRSEIKRLDALSTTASRKSKSQWTWKDIADLVKFTKTPIQNSLLRLEKSQQTKMAVEAFNYLMICMGDIPPRKDLSQVDCVYRLISICSHSQVLVDEIYCQILKQLTNNKSSKPDSETIGWRVLSIITAYFAPSDQLKPYVLKFLNDVACDTRRAFHGTSSICLWNIRQTLQYGGRKGLLSTMEIESILQGKNFRRQVYCFSDGTKKVINTRSVMVVEEAIKELCMEMNLRSAVEQQEFCLYYVIETEGIKVLLSNDQYVLDVTTELENMRKEYVLVMERNVWVHPLRWDNDLYIDVMFAQVSIDYLDGMLVIMRTPDSVSVSVMEDIATLGALLIGANENWNHQLAQPQTALMVLPRIVQNIRHTSLQMWTDRINEKLLQSVQSMTPQVARSRFLEILQGWPLFGSKFYYVDHLSDPAVVGACLLAINKRGVHFLSLITHEDLLSFRLNEILQTGKTPEGDPTMPAGFLQLKVGNLLQQRVIVIETSEATEIARTIGQYIYVDGQDKGIIYT